MARNPFELTNVRSRRWYACLVMACLGGCASLTLDHTDGEIAAMPLHESKVWTFLIGEPQHGGLCYFAGAKSYSMLTRAPYFEELERRGFDEFEVQAVAERSFYQGMRMDAFRCSRGYPFGIEITINGQIWLYCDPETDPDTDEFRCTEDSERHYVFFDDERLWNWF